jgi:hypothetical protein
MTRLLASLAATLSLALATAPVAGAMTVGSSYRYCGKVDIGYTLARVSERGGVTCHNARRLVRAWLKKINGMRCNADNKYCAVIRVRRYRCVKGSSGSIVRLRCTRGTKRVRAYWGD